MNWLKKVTCWVRREESLTSIYASKDCCLPLPDLLVYPVKEWLMHICAYHMHFMIQRCDEKILKNLINKHFEIIGRDAGNGMNRRNQHDNLVHFSFLPEFNGITVYLLTNDPDFLRSIDALNLTPVPPWIAFSNVEPDSLGSLQGDIEYWWAEYWSPFWVSLTQEEKTQYLIKNEASIKWIECINAHS